MMHIWEHLFLTGEFRARADLLSGLTLEQVAMRPAGASHSIYEELWHAAGYQRSVVEREQATGEFYPSAPPQHAEEWDDLVRQFLDGARAAVAWAESPERLALEVEPGVTMADELHSVAVHNAYHLGKIVALRQTIGAWPPKAATEES
jgi:DinB superfamily